MSIEDPKKNNGDENIFDVQDEYSTDIAPYNPDDSEDINIDESVKNNSDDNIFNQSDENIDAAYDDILNNGANSTLDTHADNENGGGEFLKKKLAEPKNLIILAVFVIFIIFVGYKIFASDGGKKPQKKVQVAQNADLPNDVIMSIDKIQKQAALSTQNQIPDLTPKALPLAPTIPELKIDVSDVPKESNIPDLPTKKEANLPAVPVVDIPKPKAQDSDHKDVTDDLPVLDKKRGKLGKDQVPPLFDFAGTGPATKKKKQNANDFIFIDSNMDTESEDNAVTSKKLANPGNLIAQGRLIDAILETAVNSSIPGNVRAIISHDVYGEMGRNILIPKGTRLYGTYSAAGAGATRMNITWSRITRPDNVVTTINSFASDQFGRAGISGDVDRKYSESITSAVLLSTIPIIGAIATSAITGARNSTTTTVGVGTGTTAYTSDPVNIATTAFTNQITKAADQIVTQMISTQTVITLPQGTRVTILVNQDMNLPTYKSITKISSEISS